jgi:hypothetical protein
VNFMDTIRQVPSYACSLCDGLSQTPDAAAACYAKCAKAKAKEDKDKKRRANWEVNMNRLRLEATSVGHVKELIVEHAKRFFGVSMEILELDVYFTDVSCSHNAPIGEKTNWGGREKGPRTFPGWSGNIKIKWKKNGRGHRNEVIDSPSELFDWSGLRGLHTGSGGGGGGQYEYGFSFFLQDFPKMAEMYKELQVLEKASAAMREQEGKQTEKYIEAAQKLYDKNPVVKKTLARIEDLNKLIAELNDERSKLVTEAMGTRNSYRQEMEKVKDEKWPIPSKYGYDRNRLKTLLKVFRGRFYCEE